MDFGTPNFNIILRLYRALPEEISSLVGVQIGGEDDIDIGNPVRYREHSGTWTKQVQDIFYID